MKAVVPTRSLERSLWDKGYAHVGGIDEVGRGPMAGPVTAAIVVLPSRCRLSGLRDSKLMTSKQRVQMAVKIREQALGVGIGWADHKEIDDVGLTQAMHRAAWRAIAQLVKQPDVVILDGHHNYLGDNCQVELCVKADQKCLAVAAASVVAKVARDRYMELLEQTCPGYGFSSHKGYATKNHREAIARLGLSAYHRRRWQTVRQLAGVY